MGNVAKHYEFRTQKLGQGIQGVPSYQEG